MNNIDINSKKAFIFDVDGTLYSKNMMKFYMLYRMIKETFYNFKTINELKVVSIFRRYRKKEKYKKYSLDDIYSDIAIQQGMKKSYIKNIIDKWMFNIPLDYINKCQYTDIINFINKEDRIKILYSDYPVYEKAKCLNIKYDIAYVPGEGITQELKPSRTIMSKILFELNKAGLTKNDIIYIGDCEEKDGKSARIVGIDYLNIIEFRKYIRL